MSTEEEIAVAGSTAGPSRTEGSGFVSVATSPAPGDKVSSEAEEQDDVADDDEEVQALSHKELRRKRKAEKQAARAHGNKDTLGTAAPLQASVHPSRAATVASANTVIPQNGVDKRGRYSVWVGNLSFRTDAERLKDWFAEHGITGITRINMPQGQRKQDHNRGFAYVDIPSAEALQMCIDLSESHLEGRKLLIKSGNDFAGRPEIDQKALELAKTANLQGTAEDGVEVKPKGKTGLSKTAQKILRAQKHAPGPTLFVGNLSFNTTEDGVREMIERSAAARDQWSGQREKRKDERKARRKERREAGDVENDDASNSGHNNDSESSEEDGEDGEPLKSDPPAKASDRENAKKKTDKGGVRGAGIRKVRLGQFEDTGKCKGFAFIDFFSPAYATASLIDPRNSRLDGRELLLQYAGADAVRRGAPKGHINGPRPHRDRAPGASKRPFNEAFEAREEEIPDLGPAPAIGSFDPDAPLAKKHKETKEERIKRREAQAATGAPRRAKPGAALANAQRGKTGIALDVPQGVKKTFD